MKMEEDNFRSFFFKFFLKNDISNTILGENMQIKRISLSLDASKSEDNKRKRLRDSWGQGKLK